MYKKGQQWADLLKNYHKFFLLNCRWGELDIVSGTGETSYSDTTIMYAAGYLEGGLTAK